MPHGNELRSKWDKCGYLTPYGCNGYIENGAHVVENMREPVMGNGHVLFHPHCCPCRVPGLTRPVFRERLAAELLARRQALVVDRDECCG